MLKNLPWWRAGVLTLETLEREMLWDPAEAETLFPVTSIFPGRPVYRQFPKELTRLANLSENMDLPQLNLCLNVD